MDVDQINKLPKPKVGNGTLALESAGPVVATQDIHALDAFQNALARIGYGTPNLSEGTDYVNIRLTRYFMTLISLYRSHWIIRKIVDVPAEDMCKNWYQFVSDIDPEMADKYQRKERVTKTKANILKALKFGRLFGGAGAVIIISGHENYLDYPLDYDTIMPDSYKGLLVFDRWSGIQPCAELNHDIESPDFGLPEHYTVSMSDGSGTFRVHSSRVLRFPGRLLPFWEEQAEMYWGTSEIELVFDELKKRDNSSWNIASLLFMANIRVLKMGDLRNMLVTGNQAVQSKLYQSLSAQNHLMSSQGILVLDENDSYEQHETTGFKGIADVYETFMLDIAGAAEMPVTKLFGRSPAGMNATGESDLQNYYDSIEQKQEAFLRPAIEKLLPVIAMSEWGGIPDDLDFAFLPPATTPSDKLAELAAKKTSSVIEVFNAGLVSERVALKELRQMSDETGMWTNITDEEIGAADKEAHTPGEMPLSGMGGAPSGEQEPGGAASPSSASTPPPRGGGADSPPSGSASPMDHEKTLGIIKKMRSFIQNYLSRRAQDKDFKESEHPRDEEGKFSSSGSSSGATSGFVSYDPAKAPKHIKNLRIPPAWTDVIYNPNPKGGLMVKGKDAKGRVQAIYSSKHTSEQAKKKFARIKELDRKIDQVKIQNEKARAKSATREQADCLALVMATGIRPGSDMDTQAKVKAYGATTLEGRHIQKKGDQVWLEFVGKKGVPLSIPVFDSAVSDMLMKRKEAVGDNGRIFNTDSSKLLSHTHTLDGGGFKTKDFRTHLATTLATKLVANEKPPSSKTEYKKKVKDVAKSVATALGNTPTVALQSYISPFVFSAWRKPEWE